ncbi:MAG: PilZ domain-containing protein [Exilispira sp.]
MSNTGNIIDGRVLNIILLSSINVVKQISNVDLTKKHIFTSSKNLPVNGDLLLIKFSGDINGDIIIKFDINLKKVILSNFVKNIGQSDYTKNDEVDKDLNHSAFMEIGNLISAKITNLLFADGKKVDISSVLFFPDKDEIFYESIFAVEMASAHGELSIYLGINELKYQRSVSFIFWGFTEELIEEIINDFIPKGMEVYYAENPKDFIEQTKSRKFDIAVIDFYIVNQDFKIFLKSYFSSLDYKINLIFGITKIDALKFQGIPANSQNYQLIGLFLKTFSVREIINYIYSILQKIGIKADDRRKDIRVNISDNNRYFVSINEKDLKFTAKLKDISIGGFRAELDSDEYKNKIQIGKIFNSVDMFLKYNRLKVNCKIVYVKDNTFSASFVDLIDQDKNIISNSIFKILCNK